MWLALPAFSSFVVTPQGHEKLPGKGTATCQVADNVRHQQPDRLLYLGAL